MKTLNSSSVISMSVNNSAVVSPFRMFGTIFENDGANLSISEVMERAKLNYKVEKQNLIRMDKDGILAIKDGRNEDIVLSRNNIITSHCATYRTDTNTTLGVVGSNYGIVQNEQAFKFIDYVNEVTDIKPKFETAGALGNGERIFVTASLGEGFMDENKKDKIEKYVVFTNTHDGTGAVMAFFTPIRVICQNTLNMAIATCQNKLSFRHSSLVNTRLDWEIEENRNKALQLFKDFNTFDKVFFEDMKKLRIVDGFTENDVKDFVAKLNLTKAEYKLYTDANRIYRNIDEISTQKKNKMDNILNSIDYGIGQDMYRGSALWLLNGITTYNNNEKKYKTDEDKFTSMFEGQSQKLTQNAYNELIRLAA